VPAILEHLADHRFADAVSLGFTCGLRGGEIGGLQWLDLRREDFTIQRQVAESAGYFEIKSP
jgi:integrase